MYIGASSDSEACVSSGFLCASVTRGKFSVKSAMDAVVGSNLIGLLNFNHGIHLGTTNYSVAG